MSKRRLIILSILCLGLLAVIGTSQAQESSNGVCPSLVDRALTEIGDNCSAIDRNNVCYGFDRVDTAFFEPQPEGFFSAPADRAALSELQSIQTTPLNSANNEWGVAVMNVQANVPGGLPGQAAVFLLYGDVQVENAVDPSQAFISDKVVNVTALVTANGRSGPGTNFNVVQGIPVGAAMSADGLNTDKTWVRALYEETTVWVSRDLVRPEVSGALNDLPVISSSARTPMQAIHLSTGFGKTECLDAPSTLVVQGPEHVHVNINVNGADIEIGSTIALRTTPDNFLQLVTLSGAALVDGIRIPAGFTIQVPLTPDGQDTAGPWTGFRALTGQELESFKWLEGTPPILLHYPIVLPTLGDIARTRAAISQPVAPPQPENGSNDSGDQTTDTTGNPQGDCAGFVPTSPLDAASTGDFTFYWDPAPGADEYRWVLLDANAGVLSIFDTHQTNFTANLKPTYTSTLQWEVHALSGGQVICVTDRVFIQLVGGGQEAPQPTQSNPLANITNQRSCIAAGGTWDPRKMVCHP